ncbi:MAG TPA: hypothetical protein VFV38_51190 [Ktedonobacteraceae bacterium]|nr:hypothetical protein [Ktedonobacteraceae bacterium]
METPQYYHGRVTIERYAERVALFQVRGVSFSHCLTLAHIQTDLVVTGEMGERLTFHGKDVVNQKTWMRFVREKEVHLEWFSYQVGAIAADYARWLRKEYTHRYRALESNEATDWLKQVARLAVLWHMMEDKYKSHRFLDAWVESEMGKLLLLRDFCREMARAVHHAIKDQEQAVALLEQAYERSLALIEDRTFAPYESPVALPEGATDPLALPAQEDEQRDA